MRICRILPLRISANLIFVFLLLVFLHISFRIFTISVSAQLISYLHISHSAIFIRHISDFHISAFLHISFRISTIRVFAHHISHSTFQPLYPIPFSYFPIQQFLLVTFRIFTFQRFCTTHLAFSHSAIYAHLVSHFHIRISTLCTSYIPFPTFRFPHHQTSSSYSTHLPLN